jgi:hypothetical protein
MVWINIGKIFCRTGGDYRFALFCFSGEVDESCVINSSNSFTGTDYVLDATCSYSSVIVCHTGICEDIDINKWIEYNAGKCTVVGGRCNVDICIELILLN